MLEHEADILVIGAGPAGLAAASAAAGRGLSVLVVDGFARAGGQYFMQPPSSSAAAAGVQARSGAAAIQAVEAAGVRLLSGVEIWGVFPDFRVYGQHEREPVSLAARALIVASGAHDRLVAFPGWALPGVMPRGAAQRLAKLSAVAPGKRCLLAGSGPFLLPVAGAVLGAGGGIAALVEAAPSIAAPLRHLLAHPERWVEVARLLAPLLRHRPPRWRGWMVVEAMGETRVEAARLARLDAHGRPDLQDTRLVENIDALLVGYGFRPQIEITALLRCRHGFDELRGGWYCEADPASGATSVAGVYAAGEVTGVAGALPARLGGELTGLACVDYLGGPPAPARRQRLLARLARARRFADGLNRLYPPPAGLHAAIRDDTVVCRCEGVSAGSLRASLRAGARESFGAKLWTRAGMGPCQGRICGWSVARLIAAETGAGMAELGFNQPRIPLRPVPLATVAACLPGATPLDTGESATP